MVEALKILWNKLTGAMLAVIAIAFGSFILFFMGKNKGKEEEKSKQDKEIIEQAKEIKKDEAIRNNDSIDVVRSRMHDKYTRR